MELRGWRLESCQARTAAAKELEGQNARREPLLACCDGLLAFLLLASSGWANGLKGLFMPFL